MQCGSAINAEMSSFTRNPELLYLKISCRTNSGKIFVQFNYDLFNLINDIKRVAREREDRHSKAIDPKGFQEASAETA